MYMCCKEYSGVEVRVCTKDGKLQRKLGRKNDGSYLFSEPYCLALTRDGAELYVSNYKNNSVTCLKANGDIVFTYTDPDLENPRGIVLDENSNFIVCSQRSQCIQVVKSGGSLYKKLIDVSYPLWFTLRNSDNTLIVCTGQKLISYSVNFD